MSYNTSKPSLEQLLRRHDIWRGHSHSFVDTAVVDSGHSALNQALLHHGWPLGSIVEVCQHYHACEWWLFHPAIRTLINKSKSSYLVLIDPPALPFIEGLQQLGLHSNKIIVVQTRTTQEFISAFSELSRSSACLALLSWQLKRRLNYAQLRKLQLATADQPGLYVIFRHLHVKQQSSPASLRVYVKPQANKLQLHIFKQRGKLRAVDVALDIPSVWQKLAPHRDLDQSQQDIRQINYSASNKGQVVVFPKISSNPRSIKERERDHH